jgi:hypothetical protein
MKLALALLAVLMFTGMARADSKHCNPVEDLSCGPPTTLPPQVFSEFFYINGWFEWTTPRGVEMEQFFVDFIGGPNDTVVPSVIWEHGPVDSFPNLGMIDPAQFGLNGQPLQGVPEPATWALGSAGILALIAASKFKLARQ